MASKRVFARMKKEPKFSTRKREPVPAHRPLPRRVPEVRRQPHRAPGARPEGHDPRDEKGQLVSPSCQIRETQQCPSKISLPTCSPASATPLRNGAPTVKCLNNKLNQGVAAVLRDEGYIRSFDRMVDDGRQGDRSSCTCKYGDRGEKVLQHDRPRVQARLPRVHGRAGDLPRPLQGLGIAIVSTSSGVMSDRKCAREARVGGEVVAVVT